MELLRRALRVLEVTRNGAPGTHPQFTGGAQWQFLAVVIDNQDFCADSDTPGRRQLFLVLGQMIGLAQQRHGMQAFSGAVDLHENIAEAFLGLAQFGRAHRCCPVGHGLQ
ncbi:hypothetical protein D3C75_1076380 [compost metagenome]